LVQGNALGEVVQNKLPPWSGMPKNLALVLLCPFRANIPWSR